MKSLARPVETANYFSQFALEPYLSSVMTWWLIKDGVDLTLACNLMILCDALS